MKPWGAAAARMREMKVMPVGGEHGLYGGDEGGGEGGVA